MTYVVLQFSIVESVFVAIMDEFPGMLRSTPRRPIIFRGVMLFIYFLISLPMVGQVRHFYLGIHGLTVLRHFASFHHFDNPCLMFTSR